MSFFTNKEDIPMQEILPGIEGRMIHMEHMTIGHFILRAGALLPTHHHPHEQVTNIISGEMKMTVGEETKLCKAGDIVKIPSNVPHSAEVISECVVIDAFQPARDDYKIE